jgi:hypothetical protein
MLRAWVLDKFAIVFCGVCALPFCVRVRDARARMAASLCVSTAVYRMLDVMGEPGYRENC